MPGYPTTEGDVLVPYEQLLADVTAIFRKAGMEPDDAALLAASLAIADLRGVHSHGVLRVPEYVHKLTRGGVNPTARPRIVREFGAALSVDAANSMGAIACAFAMRQCIERARKSGLAAAAINNSNHCGALFHPAMMALPHNQIGIVTTNALPTMAPFGGRDKILGINPLAMAVPAAEEPPLVLDAAFSASSHGKIRIYQQKGLPVPEGWAFDASGSPTTDAAAAIEGLLQPIGGYKGAGLSIMMGVLSSLLSGAAFGTELGDMVNGPAPGRDGQFVMAIHIAAFEDPDLFVRRVDGIIRQIRDSRPAPGFDRCYAPGELEDILERRYRREGIPLNAVTRAGLNQL